MSWSAPALKLTRALPTSVAVGVTRAIVLAYLALRPDYRREIRRNLRLALGRDDRWFWVRNGWRVGRNIALMTGLGDRRGRELVDNATVRWDNGSRQLMERDLHKVMASFHYGAWEFLPAVFARRGDDVGVVTAPQRDPELAAELDGLRESAGATEVRSARELVRRTRLPGVTGFVLDNTSRGPMSRGVAGDLSVRLPGTAFRLADRLGTEVMPLFCTVGRRGLEVRVHAPGDADAAARALLAEVRACPEEWVFWAKDGALAAA